MTSKHSEHVYFRELQDPLEVVAMLRLRHRIYFEELHYGPDKALRLDLTAHDTNSRLFGVFQDGVLAGGVRLVFRTEQPLGALFRALHTLVEADVVAAPAALPSEEAFDLATCLGADSALVGVEIGRLALDVHTVAPWVINHLLIAILAVMQLAGCRMYLYSCATTLAKRYARVANPRYELTASRAEGIVSDKFVFPKPTVAAVAAVEDSPYGQIAAEYAAELSQNGAIVLNADRRELHGGGLTLRAHEAHRQHSMLHTTG